jgi:peptide/nickel transport system permease protein
LPLKRLLSTADEDLKVNPVLWRVILRISVIALLGGLVTATLVRTAPGYGLGDEQLDARRSRGSLSRAEALRAGEGGILHYYARFLVNYARGDLGQSSLFQRPAGKLMKERILPTATALVAGLAGGWMLALLLGIPIGFGFWPAGEWLGRGTAILVQSLPPAVLGLLLLATGARGIAACGCALALILYPRLFQYVANLVQTAAAQPHVLMAKAKGLAQCRILRRHILPIVLPELLALAGVSASMALSAAIPLEMILDVAGLGQLAWQAALGRDMNLLVNLTVWISILLSLSNGVAGLWSRRQGTGLA